MGLIRLASRDLRELEDELEPQEVGAFDAVRPKETTATLIGRSLPGGPLVYLAEVPITVRPDTCIVRYQEAILEDGTVKFISRETPFFRDEFKFDLTSKKIKETAQYRSQVKVGYHLVKAKMPYESGLVQWSRFKGRSKERPLLILDKSNLLKPSDYYNPDKEVVAFTNIQDLRRSIRRSRLDYWEMQRRLTAAQFRSVLPIAFPNAIRNDSRLWVCSICENVRDFFEELRASERVQKLLKLTANRTIRFDYRPAPISQKIRLYEDDSENMNLLCQTIMDYSIYQSLAGLSLSETRFKMPLLGQPVLERVEQLYTGHLNKLNERIDRKINGKKTKKGKNNLVLQEKERIERSKYSH